MPGDGQPTDLAETRDSYLLLAAGWLASSRIQWTSTTWSLDIYIIDLGSYLSYQDDSVVLRFLFYF
jgi:hypothetical protein